MFKEWKKNYDIVFSSETHSSKRTNKEWSDEYGGHCIWSNGSGRAKGCAILSNKYSLTEIYTCPEGRIAIASCKLPHIGEVGLVSVYAPTSNFKTEQLKFLDKVIDKVESLNLPIILAGDTNCYFTELDKKGGLPFKNCAYRSKWLEFIQSFGLVDVWRAFNMGKCEYSWRGNSRTGVVQERLDQIFVSESIFHFWKGSKMTPCVYSDHSYVEATSHCDENLVRGKGFWKFNLSLLEDREYSDLVKSIIADKRRWELNDKLKEFDALMCLIRTESINYSKRKARNIRARKEKLESYLTELEKSIDTKIDSQHYNMIKKEIDQINNYYIQGELIKLKIDRTDDNFLNVQLVKRLKYKKANDQINELYKDQNSKIGGSEIITDQDQILQMCQQFYFELYNESKLDKNRELAQEEFLTSKLFGNKLSKEDAEFLDADFSDPEIKQSVFSQPNGKSSGLNGIPIEWIKFFWPQIGGIFCNYIKLCSKTGLSPDQKIAVLKLIPKGDKDRKFIRNKRPVSLLNASYKVYAKVLSSRIEKVIPSIISNSQNAYGLKKYILSFRLQAKKNKGRSVGFYFYCTHRRRR